jgi:hypothetical protein
LRPVRAEKRKTMGKKEREKLAGEASEQQSSEHQKLGGLQNASARALELLHSPTVPGVLRCFKRQYTVNATKSGQSLENTSHGRSGRSSSAAQVKLLEWVAGSGSGQPSWLVFVRRRLRKSVSCAPCRHSVRIQVMLVQTCENVFEWQGPAVLSMRTAACLRATLLFRHTLRIARPCIPS